MDEESKESITDAFAQRWKLRSKKAIKATRKPDLEARTVKLFRESGWITHRVSTFDARTGRAKDFLGFADVMAIASDVTVLIQVTSRSNRSSRLKKILASENAYTWLKDCATRRIWLVLWEKERGRWHQVIENVTEECFNVEALPQEYREPVKGGGEVLRVDFRRKGEETLD
jgi:hypothetical protein